MSVQQVALCYEIAPAHMLGKCLTAYSGRQFLLSFSFAAGMLGQRIPVAKGNREQAFKLVNVSYRKVLSFPALPHTHLI